MVGGADTEDLRNRSICNVSYQNISLYAFYRRSHIPFALCRPNSCGMVLTVATSFFASFKRECREEVEKVMYKISGGRDVLDSYHTWALKRGQSDAPLIRNGRRLETFDIGASDSVDLSKRSGFSGSVQYFYDFTLDASAWPSPDLHRMDVHLYSTPHYYVDSPTIIPENWRELLDGPKQSSSSAGGACFNCGQTGHALNSCPKPKDQDRIRKAINEWKKSRLEDVEVRYHSVGLQTPDSKSLRSSSSIATPGTPAARQPPKAGVISERLQQALGIGSGDMPPWYRNIVYYGYPPSYYRVPEGPVKFTWVDNNDTEAASSAPAQKATARTRTVAFPNLAAPLHDLSLFLDLYHPVEATEPADTSSSTPSTQPSAKYRVTTVIDGDKPFIPPSSRMVVDLTDGDASSSSADDPFKTPVRNTKKRSRSEEDDTEDQDAGEAATKKRAPESDDDDGADADDSQSWADSLLDKLKKDKILTSTEEDAEDAKEDENVVPIVPADQVTAHLPQGDGVIRHGLSEQDLSTHGSMQQSTGVWQKLKNLLEERK